MYAGASGGGRSQRLLGLVNYDLGRARSPYGALLTPIVGEAMTLPEVAALFDADPLMVFGGYRSGSEQLVILLVSVGYAGLSDLCRTLVS